MRLAIAVVVLACARAAFAQPAPPPEPPADPPAEPAPMPEPAPAPAPVERRDDTTWNTYHQAFEALARGQRAKARDLAAALLRTSPQHPASDLVRRSELGVGPGEVDRPATTAKVPTRTARAELAAFQTLHGIIVGVELDIAIQPEDGIALIGIPLVTGLAGALVSLNIGELTSGQRALLNSGTAWGALNAALVMIASEPEDEEAIALGLIAGQAAGLAIGAGLSKERPTAGQVALANSGGQWTLALTGLALAALDSDSLDGQDIAIALLVAADVGIGVGAYLGKLRPDVSRGQTLVIDAGGIVGAVGGAAAGVFISGNGDSRGVPAAAAVGALVGLGTAAYFTRNWGGDRGASNMNAFVRPSDHGRGGVAGLAFTW